MSRNLSTSLAQVRPSARSGVLRHIDDAFARLVARPEPLAIHGEDVAGLPDRWIALDELRSMLLHPSTGYATRDAAMALLVTRARASEDWKVGLLGVLAPGLASMAGRARVGYPGDFEDVAAEVVAGVLDAVGRIDVAEGRIASRLLGVAFTRAWSMVRHERRRRRWEEAAAATVPANGHGDPAASPAAADSDGDRDPSDVLQVAVVCGVVTAAEAWLVSRTRLDGVPLLEVAAGLRISHAAVRQRRSRAERRLVRWLAELGTGEPVSRLSRGEGDRWVVRDRSRPRAAGTAVPSTGSRKVRA